ncbi:MAG: GNAT family N-acetyltransferase [Nanoarchaeota archaeon]|nr:GNAT family N-acetyltransferase [Nanoarchaeota archaeon]
MKDGKYELADIKVVGLSRVFNLSDFNCGDDDLNDFIKNDAFGYQDKKMTSTILIIEKDKVIGFFSLSADAIKLGNLEKDQCDNLKPQEEYPSIKISRLAVDKSLHRIGKLIIQIAVGIIRNMVSNVIGCRFITVDSYNEKVDFYKNFGFVFNEHSKYKKKDHYISMRFDLLNPPQIKK